MNHWRSKTAPADPLVTEGQPDRCAPRVLKLYDVVRTAHLERIEQGAATTILYRSRRYDFHVEAMEGLDVCQAGIVRTMMHCLLKPIDIIEINEPLIARTAPRSLAAVIGNRARAACRMGPRARVVTYAIESLDPAIVARDLPWRARWKWRLQACLIPAVWASVDRLALGTELAEQVYRGVFRGRWPEHRVVPALPAPRLSSPRASPRSATLVFLGDLSARKGFPQVLDAWPIVRERVPDARLIILGRGEGEAAAIALAERDDSVTVHIDPPRARIFDVLAQCKVLALPSRSTPRWREQVGLPIVEGLASGCLIVTTTETGLAPWLQANGHSVVRPADEAELAAGITMSLESKRTPADVLATLPALDGRLAAEQWLYERAR